jgi:hypothetical protein
VEKAGVVAPIRLQELLHQPRIDLRPVLQAHQLAVGFDTAVFADAQKDDSVDGMLHGEVQFAR